jgi:hypothetical protein
MININKTLIDLNIDITKLKPNSCKNVIWNCGNCSLEKIKKFRDAQRHKLCLNCSNKINANTNLKIRSLKVKKWYQNNKHPLLGVQRPEHIKKLLDRTGKLHSEKTKKIISEKNKGVNNGFYGKKHSKETCKKLSNNAKKNVKKGKESNFYGKIYHGKRKYYFSSEGKKYLMRSTWEIKFAKYLDDNNINWEYEPKSFELIINNKEVTYTPDFYLKDFNEYIEIKGWWRDDAKLKYDAFVKKYNNIKIKVYGKRELKNLGVL